MILDEETEKSIEKINGNGKEEVTWLVHGSKGSNISIGVYHPKGGRALKKIKLLR
jgi:hypothetical protein